jgi:hypothetical protein
LSRSPARRASLRDEGTRFPKVTAGRATCRRWWLDNSKEVRLLAASRSPRRRPRITKHCGSGSSRARSTSIHMTTSSPLSSDRSSGASIFRGRIKIESKDDRRKRGLLSTKLSRHCSHDLFWQANAAAMNVENHARPVLRRKPASRPMRSRRCSTFRLTPSTSGIRKVLGLRVIRRTRRAITEGATWSSGWRSKG